jgi:hypothetical protein
MIRQIEIQLNYSFLYKWEKEDSCFDAVLMKYMLNILSAG